MGLYLYDNEDRAYLCASEDGNSFTLSGQYPGRYSDDGHFDGVFYRDGDIAAYTDLEKAKFYYGNGSDTWLWYNDGVNEYFLGMSIRLAMMDLPIMKRIIRSILEDGFLMNPMTLP